VVRASVDQWPVKFSLNDSQAMLPQRKLSDFRRVIVEARISQSGQPLSQRGDLQGSSGTLDPKSDKPIRVVIHDVIG
jgi:cytochrome c-type biogenesis protein CcmH